MKKMNKADLSMKTFFSVTIMTLLLMGCDAPRRERSYTGGSSENDLFGMPMSSNNNGSTSGSTTGSTTSGSTTGSTTGSVGGVAIPSEVSQCSWSSDGVNGFENKAAHLSPNEDNVDEGAYTLCQSNINEQEVYLQVKNPIGDAQLCLIPTSHDGSNSVYVGEPRCLYVNSSQTLYKISLIKNRQGYTNRRITGVMMMKDKAYQYEAPFYQYILSPDAYIFCSQWLALYYDPSYCIAFKNKGAYVYHQF